MSGKILVTGGAGYIGSHMLACLKQHNMDAVVVDNLCTGHAAAILCCFRQASMWLPM